LLAGEALDDETVIGADRFKLTFGASPYEMPPAVAFARPAFLLHAYRALVESDRGRRHVDRLQRWLRGGRRERTARVRGWLRWGREGSNLRPRDYESPALTTELRPRHWGL